MFQEDLLLILQGQNLQNVSKFTANTFVFGMHNPKCV